MAPSNQENDGTLAARCHCHCHFHWFKTLPAKSRANVVTIAEKAKKIGNDDPRKVIHALKVGLAVTLVSLFYYFEPLYDGFGVNAMWALLTTVIVFEFSVGATMGKGLNRMMATLVAGALGLLANWVATLCGKTGEPILLATFVYIIAATITFIRFFPEAKARYDFGLLVFILTFCLVSISGYREDEVLGIALKRISTIIIGSCTAMIVCVCIRPVWVGEDLHNLIASNLEKTANSLQGFGGEYFGVSKQEQANNDKSFLQGYKSVLTSSNSEETMASLATWEPRHGRFRFRHPWKQYLKVGTLTRQCAYRIEALNSYLNSEIQTPLEIRKRIEEPCMTISTETGKALKEVASIMNDMIESTSANIHLANSNSAAENLKSVLKTEIWDDTDLLEMAPAVAVASLLLDIVTCTQSLVEAVDELASLARFKKLDSTMTQEQRNSFRRGTVQPISNDDVQHHIVNLAE
ncbi:PREDICTED: aluminum-activated malate transporter 2-like [Theobroma cacao]|uniref:Aluminum-activated malate transporter 2-like n=1 Tax=Theobroma cacao TaxID=3641 RepID=A0AB32WSC9_THECC|nr:PREDICTED: aluminum-activated malate transporter 2-like [Theobroma cacao]